MILSKAQKQREGERTSAGPGTPGRRAVKRQGGGHLLLMGMMSWGMTGRILGPPCSSMSWTPWQARTAYG